MFDNHIQQLVVKKRKRKSRVGSINLTLWSIQWPLGLTLPNRLAIFFHLVSVIDVWFDWFFSVFFYLSCEQTFQSLELEYFFGGRRGRKEGDVMIFAFRNWEIKFFKIIFPLHNYSWWQQNCRWWLDQLSNHHQWINDKSTMV